MSLICRSCLTKSEKDYFSLLTVFPEFGKNSILDLLNFVTSSGVSYSSNLPGEICMKCFKSLKIAYYFIVQFKNSQTLLQKDAEKLFEEDIVTANQKVVKPDVHIKKEESLSQILKSDHSDRIIIVSEDGSAYEDMVQEIFGAEEITDKKENIERKKTNSTTNPPTKTSSKIIMMSVDDVLKEETFSKHQVRGDKVHFNKGSERDLKKNPSKIVLESVDDVLQKKQGEKLSSNHKNKDILKDIDKNVNISSLKEENMFEEEEDDNSDIASDEVQTTHIKEENEYYLLEENEDDNTFRDSNEEDDVVSDSQIFINEDNVLDENSEVDILQNHNKNINNIQIITIDDVKSEEKIKSNRKTLKKVLSIEDVLNVKPRAKRNKQVNTSSDIQVYKCPFCENTFDNQRKLMFHKMRIHNPNWKEKFLCKICGEQSKTMSAYNHHLIKHKNRRFQCDRCEKSYLSKSKMKEHILRVHEKAFDNKYLCTECGKGFKFSNALEYHMNKHSNLRNFICRFCGFASMARSALKRHERTHTGERPYECKYCGKTFAGAAEKQKHEFGHEGVFPYACKYCKKPFIQTYNMKVHWMQHKGAYNCELCDRGFADAEILKFHYAHSHKIKDVIIEDADEDEPEIKEEDDIVD